MFSNGLREFPCPTVFILENKRRFQYIESDVVEASFSVSDVGLAEPCFCLNTEKADKPLNSRTIFFSAAFKQKSQVTAFSVKGLLSLPPDEIVFCFPQDSTPNRLFKIHFQVHYTQGH